MARLMSSTELHERISEDDDFVLLDVREHEHFIDGHIEGARSLPLENLKEEAEKAKIALSSATGTDINLLEKLKDLDAYAEETLKK